MFDVMTGVHETVSESHVATTAAYSDVEAGNGQLYEKRNAGDYYYLFV